MYYSFGWNGDGQLGQGDFANLITPALVDSFSNDINVCKVGPPLVLVNCGLVHDIHNQDLCTMRFSLKIPSK